MKKYDWLRDVSSYDYGSIVYVTFNLYDYEELGIKYYHWVDEDGFDNCIDYFKVDKALVTIYNDDSIFIKSENVNKVLEYIDKVVSL